MIGFIKSNTILALLAAWCTAPTAQSLAMLPALISISASKAFCRTPTSIPSNGADPPASNGGGPLGRVRGRSNSHGVMSTTFSDSIKALLAFADLQRGKHSLGVGDHISVLRSLDLSAEELGYLHAGPTEPSTTLPDWIDHLQRDSSARLPEACRRAEATISVPSCAVEKVVCRQGQATPGDRNERSDELVRDGSAASAPGHEMAPACNPLSLAYTCDQEVLGESRLRRSGYPSRVRSHVSTCNGESKQQFRFIEEPLGDQDTHTVDPAKWPRRPVVYDPGPQMARQISPKNADGSKLVVGYGNPGAQVGPMWIDLTQYGVIGAVSRRHTDLYLPTPGTFTVRQGSDLCDGIVTATMAKLGGRTDFEVDVDCSISNIRRTDSHRKLRRDIAIPDGASLVESIAIIVSATDFPFDLGSSVWWQIKDGKLVRAYRWDLRGRRNPTRPQ